MEDDLLKWIRAEANQRGNELLAVRIEGWAIQKSLSISSALFVVDRLVDERCVRREPIENNTEHFLYGLEPEGKQRLKMLDSWPKQTKRIFQSGWSKVFAVIGGITIVLGLFVAFGNAVEKWQKMGITNLLQHRTAPPVPSTSQSVTQ